MSDLECCGRPAVPLPSRKDTTAKLISRSGTYDLVAGRLRDDLPDVTGYVVVRVERPARIPRLDGRALEAMDDGTFIGDVVLIGDSGYHELHVFELGRPVPLTFAFCTTRAKRRAPLIREMMEFAGRLAAVPERLFSLGALGDEHERVPGVIVGWMTQRLPEIVTAIAAVGRQPVVPIRAAAVEQPFAVRLNVAATRRLIRSKPRVLREREEGMVTVGGKRYTPEFAVDQRARSDADTPEHRQIVAFAGHLLREVAILRREGRLGPYAAQIDEWERELRSALSRPLWRLIRAVRGINPLRAPRTPLQRQDRRYSQLYDLLQEYRGLRAYEPADDEMRTVLEGAPRIFQAFAAYAIADAFGLQPVGPSLAERHDKASFVSDDARLYYDVKPPESVLRSWRDQSVLSERSRPDIVLASRRLGVLVADAKFKDYRDGGDLLADLREMHVYHDSFGLSRSCILCPFHDPLDVGGDGRLMRIVRVRPVPFTEAAQLAEYLRERLTPLFNAPGQTSG